MSNKRIPTVAIWPEPSGAGAGSGGSGSGPGMNVFDVATDSRFSGGAVGDGIANDRAALAAMDAADHDNLIPAADVAFKVGSDLTFTRATWFQEGGIIRPSGAGVDIVFASPIVAGSWQIFDESLGGTVTLNEYDTIDVCWYGCSAELDAAANTAIIKSLLLRYRSLLIPPFVDWNGYVDSQAETGKTLSYDNRHRQLIIGGQVLRFPKDESKGHIANMPFVRGAADAGLWSMPNGAVTAEGGPAPRPAGKHAVFLDDYGENAANPDEFGNVDYRDGTLIGNLHEGSLGLGVIRLQAKSNGRYVPGAPELHLSLYGSSQTPMRIVRLQPRPAVSGNYFVGGGPYVFNYEMPTWRPGKPVTQGQLIIEAGKIYEAQSAGVTGNIPVIHGRYRKKRLNLSMISGAFVVGETIKELGTPDVPNGDLEVVEGGGNYLLQKWNQVTFTPGEVVTGFVSGATATILSVTDVDVDVDNNDNNFVPPGPAVWGRIESDGNIDWLFIDNIIGYIRGNDSMKGIVILGDDAALLPWPGFNDVGTHVIEDMMFYNGRRLRFLNAAGNEANAGIDLTSNSKLQVKGPDHANAEVHIYARYGLARYLRILPNQVTAVDMPIVQPTATAKPSGATTHSMEDGNYVVFNDAVPTNFTQFLDLVVGMEFTVRFLTVNTTLVNSANLRTRTGANFTPAAFTMYKFVAHGPAGATMLS